MKEEGGRVYLLLCLLTGADVRQNWFWTERVAQLPVNVVRGETPRPAFCWADLNMPAALLKI